MKYIVCLILILNLGIISVFGQRINFKPFVQDESIIATVVQNPLGLNFNDKQRVIVSGDPAPVNVLLSDAVTVVLEVDAPLDYDLTFEVSHTNLTLNGSGTGSEVPFTLRYAYNNTGESSDSERRLSAVEVPVSYNVVTLPVYRRRNGGPPAPPPTPDHAGYTRPRGKVYVYFYGSLNGIPADTPAGNYAGEVTININYSDNAF